MSGARKRWSIRWAAGNAGPPTSKTSGQRRPLLSRRSAQIVREKRAQIPCAFSTASWKLAGNSPVVSPKSPAISVRNAPTISAAFALISTFTTSLDYYTKTTFEITTSKLGAQNSILGGGRYDDMMKDFGGPDICGIGFAMGVERLLEVSEQAVEPERFLYLAYLGDNAKNEAIRLARFLRQKGIECLIEFREKGLKSQLSRASKLQASWTLIIGEDELRRGRYQVKDMKSGTQTEAGKEDILGLLGRPGS
jgi:hypothetical protein